MNLDHIAEGIAQTALEEFSGLAGDVGPELKGRALEVAQNLARAQLQRLAGQSVDEAQTVARASFANLTAAGGQKVASALLSAVHVTLVRGLEGLVAAAG